MWPWNWFKKSKVVVENAADGIMIIAQLNARVKPIDRGEYFEDPLDDVLQAAGVGEVTGGGTQMADDPAGIAFCDLEIVVGDASEQVIQTIITTLEKHGAPKGSKLISEAFAQDIPFGQYEGMALFLNGNDLPDEVYETSDVNEVIETCGTLMGEGGDFRGFWEGSQEVGLYFYGQSFEQMKSDTADFIAGHPLCEGARIEKIA